MQKFYKYIFIGILVLAGLLRFWQISAVPASLDWDEVGLGYSAYSILQTGRDEYGKFLPFVLESFGDYKPALYAYLIIPFILLFDLSVTAVRFPSAIMGLVAVAATYFLVFELFKRKGLALASAFFLAISPWHIQFSRVGFEANLGVTLNILTALFFLKGLKRPIFLFPTALFAGVSVYAYQSEKLFMPIFLLILTLVYFKQIIKIPRIYLFSAVTLFGLIVLPMFLYTTFSSEGLARARSTSIFTQEIEGMESLNQRIQYNQEQNDNFSMLFDNKYIFFGKQIAEGYLVHFDPNWLFITGDIPRHHAPSMGLLYIAELPFLLIGIFILSFIWLPRSKDRKPYAFLLLWFLTAPVPASITLEVPHAVRTLNFIPTFQIFVAIGFVSSVLYLLNKFRSRLTGYAILLFIGIFMIFNFVYYLNQYFVQQNYFHSKDWQYGYKELVAELEKIRGDYEKVVISSVSPMDQSYMFFLFYKKYPPSEFQKVRISGTNNFDRYEFRRLDWERDKDEKGTLFIGSVDQFPTEVEAIKIIYYPNGQPAMKIVAP